MATMKTTAKINPITGIPSNGNPRKEARQEKRQVRREERTLNKNLNEGIKKSGDTKIYYKGVPVENKTRLERKMEKYGVEPTSSKLSASQQKEINKNKVKLAKDKIKAEKRQERNANPTKFDTFVMKTLGKGKYDKGSMRKTIVPEGEGGKPNKKTMDASCKKPK